MKRFRLCDHDPEISSVKKEENVVDSPRSSRRLVATLGDERILAAGNHRLLLLNSR